MGVNKGNLSFEDMAEAGEEIKVEALKSESEEELEKLEDAVV